MLPEKEYYKATQKFIEKRFNCISTGIRKGDTTTGQVDVVGAYEIGSEFCSDIEVVNVEIKTSSSSFGKSLGQILGYSVYGERCYLAVTYKKGSAFTQEQEYLANHLGVGLIRIPVDNNFKPKTSDIRVILTSKKHNPILSQKSFLLNSIGIAKCALCEIYDLKKRMQYLKRDTGRKDLFTNLTWKTPFLCESCYCNIVPESERMKRESYLEGGKKASKTKRRKKAVKKAIETRRKKKERK